MNVVVL